MSHAFSYNLSSYSQETIPAVARTIPQLFCKLTSSKSETGFIACILFWVEYFEYMHSIIGYIRLSTCLFLYHNFECMFEDVDTWRKHVHSVEGFLVRTFSGKIFSLEVRHEITGAAVKFPAFCFVVFLVFMVLCLHNVYLLVFFVFLVSKYLVSFVSVGSNSSMVFPFQFVLRGPSSSTSMTTTIILEWIYFGILFNASFCNILLENILEQLAVHHIYHSDELTQVSTNSIINIVSTLM